MKRLSKKIKDRLSQTAKEKPDGEAKGGSGVFSSPAPTSGPSKTASVTTATTRPARHVKSSVPRSLSPVPTSPALAPSPTDQPAVSDKASPPTCADIDPWARAYEIVQEREHELMADYKRHIASSQDDAAPSGDLLTTRTVESVVNKLFEIREKKQWRVSLLGNDVKFREQVERLAKFLLWSDPVVKNALSAQPYAALAWSGVSILLPLLTSGTTQKEAMLNGFNWIGDLQVYWQICEKAYLQSAHRQDYQHLVEPLAKLYSYIIEYQARVICHLSEAQLSRAWQDVAGSHRWTETKEEIDKLDGVCRRFIPIGEQEEIRKNRDAQLEEMQKSRIIQENILNIIKESRQDEKETRLLEDLARAAGDYHRYKNINRKRVSGTCEWFLTDQRFCKWRDSKSPSLLWVSAGPGRGKSVLSRSLIDEGHLNAMSTITITRSAILASGSPTTICYFFFKDGSDGRMGGAHALCAMLHQLFTCPSTSGLIKYALPSHKQNGATLTEKFFELWRILVECVTSSGAGEFICVLDALDECKEESRHEIISTLEQFYSPSEGRSTTSKLKFLVTSRPYEDLEISFQKFRATAAYMRFDGDDKSEQIRREIDLVIDARVQDIAGSFTPDDQHKISERLKSMENRTYLWLHLTFDIIEKNRTDYGKRSDVEKLLSKLPSRVSDAYETILNRSTNHERTKLLLQIVLAAAQPLTLDEANVALTLALQKEELASHAALESELWPRANFQSIVKNICGLFISVYEAKLSFIHQTAREFLINRERQGTWEGSLNVAKSHTTMSQVCLHYMLLPDIGKPIGDDSIEDKYPFLSYAAAHWPLHYGSQESAAAVQCRKHARLLCNIAGYQANIWAPNYLEQRNLQYAGWSDLALASYLGLKQVVQVILFEEKTDVDIQGGNYGRALQAASAEDHREIAHILLDKGADVNAQGGYYGNALQAASAEDHGEIVKLLLDKGADVNAQGGFYVNALYAASVGGHEAIAKLLLDKGAEVNAPGGYYGNALQAASSGSYEAIVKLLLDKGADVNAEGGRYGNALYAALDRGHETIVKLLLDKGAGVNAQVGYYGNALHEATDIGHEAIVKLLLDKGADVNAQGGWYGSALQTASSRGYEAIAKLLLDKGADVNAQGGEYGNALQTASVRGHEAIVKLLLNKGANVNAQGGRYGNALQAASERGDEAIVKLLLDKGADINAQGGQYGNALQAASSGGHEAIVKLLLDKGADVNAQVGYYGNALHEAIDIGHEAIVKLLLDKGADVNAQGGWYGSALQAVSSGGHEAIAKLLLDKGADVNAQGGEYGSALQAASSGGHEAIVKLLLDKGADVNAQGGQYGNALQAASADDHGEIVKLLLDKGADVNTQRGRYGNALQAASVRGHEAIVKLLLNKGADVNAQGGQYGNALQAASSGGHEAIVKLLLDKGADVNAEGGQYGNALQAASERGDEAIVKLLLEKGANANAQGIDLHSSLSIAAGQGRNHVLQVLLSISDIDVNSKDVFNQTPLLWAAANGHPTSVQLLLANDNVLPDVPDILFGQSPLSWAAKRGHLSTAELLASNSGVNLDSRDTFGRTPLWLAAANGHKGVVELLLAQCNLDPQSKDVFGFTLFSLVAERGEHEISSLLHQACTEKGLTADEDDLAATSVEDIYASLCTACLPSIKTCQGDFEACDACLERRTFWLA